MNDEYDDNDNDDMNDEYDDNANDSNDLDESSQLLKFHNFHHHNNYLCCFHLVHCHHLGCHHQQ